MRMDPQQFREYVLIHGTNILDWPEDIRMPGLKALDASLELQAILEDEERFEMVLKESRYEDPSPVLSERIISAALQQKDKRSHSIVGFFEDLFWEFGVPNRSITAVSISLLIALVLGFAIGFFNPSAAVSLDQKQISLEAFLYYEGDEL
ncbi:MAG: hypothetical protein AVO38_10860 [delta proteobacterium ML8_D]|jgi:hypothetical protein|nr:MAG: hypothetical protein AVO38_10860 [delta proteobacterium ML8_D]